MELLPLVAPHAVTSASCTSAVAQLARNAAEHCSPRNVCASIGQVLNRHSPDASEPAMGVMLSALVDLIPGLLRRISRRKAAALRELAAPLAAYAQSLASPANALLERCFDLQQQQAVQLQAAPLGAAVQPTAAADQRDSRNTTSVSQTADMPKRWQQFVESGWRRFAALAGSLRRALASPGPADSPEALEAQRALSVIVLQFYGHLGLAHVPRHLRAGLLPPRRRNRGVAATLPGEPSPESQETRSNESSTGKNCDLSVDSSQLEALLDVLAQCGTGATSSNQMDLLTAASPPQHQPGLDINVNDAIDDDDDASAASSEEEEAAAGKRQYMALAAAAALVHWLRAGDAAFWGPPQLLRDAKALSSLFAPLVQFAGVQQSQVGTCKAMALVSVFCDRFEQCQESEPSPVDASSYESSAVQPDGDSLPSTEGAQLLRLLQPPLALPALPPREADLCAALQPTFDQLAAVMAHAAAEDVRMTAYSRMQRLLALLPPGVRFQVKRQRL